MHSFSSNRIFLIGYMGSGKSSVAKLLAQDLSFLFLDTDEAIVSMSGKSIAEIFREEGAAKFREQEEKMSRFIITLDKVVVATGGGLPCYSNNMPILLRSGITTYLECNPEVLTQRIIADETERPLHNPDQSYEKVFKEVCALLKARQKVYQEAHITINANQSPEKAKEDILSKIRAAN